MDTQKTFNESMDSMVSKLKKKELSPFANLVSRAAKETVDETKVDVQVLRKNLVEKFIKYAESYGDKYVDFGSVWKNVSKDGIEYYYAEVGCQGFDEFTNWTSMLALDRNPLESDEKKVQVQDTCNVAMAELDVFEKVGKISTSLCVSFMCRYISQVEENRLVRFMLPEVDMGVVVLRNTRLLMLKQI